MINNLQNITADQSINDPVVEELLQGLLADDKYINPKFFYDRKGSQLFEQIMRLEDYYPTRTELQLLEQCSQEIADIIGTGQVLIEPGAGNCEKVRQLLPVLQPKCYIPNDISATFLSNCAAKLQQSFEHIDIQAYAGDMSNDYPIPTEYQQLKRTAFYPGSTISNFEPSQALQFLYHLRQQIGPEGGLLIGVDLIKDHDILHRAYNDSEGVTALFNLNVLNHCNLLLASDFDPELFTHVAFFNAEQSRIEMHLESRCQQRICLHDQDIHFREGERIHTEYSYKYSLASFADLAAQAGFRAQQQWIDEKKLFSLQYFTCVS